MVNTCTKFIYTIKDCHPNLSNHIYTQFQHQINLLSIWYLFFFPFETKRKQNCAKNDAFVHFDLNKIQIL